MAIGSDFLDLVAHIVQVFKNPGISNKGNKYKVNKSLLSGVDVDNLDPSSPLVSFLGQNTKQLRKELRNYHLVKAIISLYSSTILDAIESSSLQVTNAKEGRNKLTDFHLEDINNFNDQIDIKNFIRKHIDDMLYFGKFVHAFKVDYPSKGKFIFEKVVNPYDFYSVELKDQSYLAMYSLNNEIVQKNADNFVYYFNQIKDLTELKDLDLLIDEDFENNISNEEDFDSFDDIIPKVVYHTGVGLLDDNLNLILSIYLNEYLLDQLTLRDVTRKDIIIADIKDPKTPRTDVSEAMDDFNETFNNNFLYNGLTSSLHAMTALIATNILYEGTAILPGHENYTNFDILDVPDLSKKKEDLADLQLAQRNKLFTNKGIPEGTFEGIGNKWDTLDDQSRFMTEIKNSLTSVIDFIKDINIKYLNDRYNLSLLRTDLNIELSTTNTITNSKWNRDIGLSAKMISEVSSILRTAKDDTGVENLYIDKKKYLEAINSALELVNPSLTDLILIDETIKKSNEIIEEDNSNNSLYNNNQEKEEIDNSQPLLKNIEDNYQEDLKKISEKSEADNQKIEKQKEEIDSLKKKEDKDTNE